jgi:iron-sulfur cluster repair protein YtfE (RIC family)
MNYKHEELSQWVEHRFKNEATISYSISHEFQLDLLIAFEDPEGFDTEYFLNYSLQEVIDYIKHTHEFYKNTLLRDLQISIERYSQRHTMDDSTLLLNRLFFNLNQQIRSHIGEEDELLLPYIQKLEDIRRGEDRKITVMEKLLLMDHLMNHDKKAESNILNVLKEISRKVEEEHIEISVLQHKLELLLIDLTVHSRIEDLVLIPKAMHLEQKILQDY